MGRLAVGLVYLAAICLYFLLVAVYVPLLTALGIPAQVASVAVGVWTLVCIGAAIYNVFGQ